MIEMIRRLWRRSDRDDNAISDYLASGASPELLERLETTLAQAGHDIDELREIRQTAELMRSIDTLEAPRSYALTPDSLVQRGYSGREIDSLLYGTSGWQRSIWRRVIVYSSATVGAFALLVVALVGVVLLVSGGEAGSPFGLGAAEESIQRFEAGRGFSVAGESVTVVEMESVEPVGAGATAAPVAIAPLPTPTPNVIYIEIQGEAVAAEVTRIVEVTREVVVEKVIVQTVVVERQVEVVREVEVERIVEIEKIVEAAPSPLRAPTTTPAPAAFAADALEAVPTLAPTPDPCVIPEETTPTPTGSPSTEGVTEMTPVPTCTPTPTPTALATPNG